MSIIFVRNTMLCENHKTFHSTIISVLFKSQLNYGNFILITKLSRVPFLHPLMIPLGKFVVIFLCFSFSVENILKYFSTTSWWKSFVCWKYWVQ